MRKWLFGLGGAALGGLTGLAVSVGVVAVCTVTVGEPHDLGTTITLGLGTVFGGSAIGAVAGAYLGGKFGGRKGPPNP